MGPEHVPGLVASGCGRKHGAPIVYTITADPPSSCPNEATLFLKYVYMAVYMTTQFITLNSDDFERENTQPMTLERCSEIRL